MSNRKEIKKSRTKNTSQTQYEIYLNFMETDYCFRSGTINPTLDENYLNNKWKDLFNKLNSCGDGPALVVEEWQRRFRDWKYSTKAKYRKLHVHRLQTGSGPPSDIKISDLENRGLSVWGKSTVTGAPAVILYEGVAVEMPIENTIIINTSRQNNEDIGEDNCQTVEEVPWSSSFTDNNNCEIIYDTNIDAIPASLSELPIDKTVNTETNVEPKEQNSNKIRTPKHGKSKTRPAPLSELASTLLNKYEISSLPNLIAQFKHFVIII